MIAVPSLLNVEAGEVQHVAAELFISRIGHPPIDDVICAPPYALDNELVAVAAYAAIIRLSGRHGPE